MNVPFTHPPTPSILLVKELDPDPSLLITGLNFCM
jgi:hypothetical protein